MFISLGLTQVAYAANFGSGTSDADAWIKGDYVQSDSRNSWYYGTRDSLFYGYAYSNYLNLNYHHISLASYNVDGTVVTDIKEAVAGRTAFAQSPNSITGRYGTCLIQTK